jgi:hypothetical protein
MAGYANEGFKHLFEDLYELAQVGYVVASLSLDTIIVPAKVSDRWKVLGFSVMKLSCLKECHVDHFWHRFEDHKLNNADAVICAYMFKLAAEIGVLLLGVSIIAPPLCNVREKQIPAA